MRIRVGASLSTEVCMHIDMVYIFMYMPVGDVWHLSNLLGCVGVRGVMVIVIGNGPGNTSSNPRQDWLHFT